jgi:hypothetical protein
MVHDRKLPSLAESERRRFARFAAHPGRKHDWRFYGWRDNGGFVSFIVVPLTGTKLERCQDCGIVEPEQEHLTAKRP